jgi:hypothetical protein
MTPHDVARVCAVCGRDATIVDESPDTRSDESWCARCARPRPISGFKRIYLTDRRVAGKGGFS